MALADGLYHPAKYYKEGPAFGIRILSLTVLQTYFNTLVITIVHTETLIN